MKRFYANVTVAEAEGGWRVLLDGKPIKTAIGNPQLLPTRALAEALAAEWAAQGPEIAPGLFLLRDTADYAIDIVGGDREGTIDELLNYASTDTLCYRAPRGDPIRPRQEALWEPLLQAAEVRYSLHFERIEGVIHRPQPASTLLHLETALGELSDFTMAALRSLTSLSASLVIGLAALESGADVKALWDAANLEEDWQAEQWGKDEEAQARRGRREAGFAAAARFAGLVREEEG